jgi:hypothetical protein
VADDNDMERYRDARAWVEEQMTQDTTKGVRAICFTVGSVLMMESLSLAQTFGTTPAEPDVDFWKWAVTQGGLVIVTLVILWTYRNDFKKVLAAERADHEQTRQVLEIATAIAREYGTHITANTEVMRAMKSTLDVMSLQQQRRDG